MTTNTDVHTCSYYCERPECVRRQRDEMRERLESALAQQPAAEALFMADSVHNQAMPGTREGDMVVLETDAAGKPTIWCDPEIADLVRALNDGGLRTVASCSGHGGPFGIVTLKDGRELLVLPDYETTRKAERILGAALAAEAQGGGEVVQRLRGVLQHAKMGNSYLISQDLIHKAIGAITAPPSAPVGVEDIAVELERYADCPGSVLALAGKLRALAQQTAAPSGEAGAFDANFLQSVASLCRAAYDLCQPKPQRTPEDPREHYGELCLLELASIADEIERRLAAAEGVPPEGSRSVTNQLLHWGGIPVRVTGTVTTAPGNWSLIDAAQHQESRP